MPPRYAFGFHQGCYGYYDRAAPGERGARLSRGAYSARRPAHRHRPPGQLPRLHPQRDEVSATPPEMIAGLHANGFKCSTVVTPLVTHNPLDERGEMVPFRATPGTAGVGGPALRRPRRAGAAACGLFVGQRLLRRQSWRQSLPLPAAGAQPRRRDAARRRNELPRSRPTRRAGSLGRGNTPI